MVHEKFLVFLMLCNFLTGLFGMMVKESILDYSLIIPLYRICYTSCLLFQQRKRLILILKDWQLLVEKGTDLVC